MSRHRRLAHPHSTKMGSEYGRSTRSSVGRPTASLLTDPGVQNYRTWFLVTAFIIPFLALDVRVNGFWRTQLLPSPFACVAFMAGLYFLVIRLIKSRAIRVTLITGPIVVALACGFVANALYYEHLNKMWDTLRAPVERLLLAVPGVKDGTIIMLQDVPPRRQLWGSNYWFDQLMRLAYPRRSVAGSYTFANNPSDSAAVQAVVAAGGELVTLASGRQVLAPHGHLFFIYGDRVSLARTFLSTFVDSGRMEQVVVVRWTESGPFQVAENADIIAMVVGPKKEYYAPYARIQPQMSDVARRRFVHP
jgi:hypothetical protein